MAKKNKQLDIPQELVDMLTYDPERGLLYWNVRRRGRGGLGAQAGSVLKATGYVIVAHKGVRYLAHRIIWKMVHGHIPEGMEIDHANAIKADNRITNLRPATKSQNAANCKTKRNNTSGFKGVSWRNGCKYRPWVASIKIDGKRSWLGHHATPEEAHAAYMAALTDARGEFARAA